MVGAEAVGTVEGVVGMAATVAGMVVVAAGMVAMEVGMAAAGMVTGMIIVLVIAAGAGMEMTGTAATDVSACRGAAERSARNGALTSTRKREPEMRG